MAKNGEVQKERKKKAQLEFDNDKEAYHIDQFRYLIDI